MQTNTEQIIESIRQLPLPEQEKVRQWLEEKNKSNGAEDWQIKAGRSAKSLRWLDENRRQYLGKWIALDGDRLIAAGQSAKEVYAKAKSEGVKIPFVELVTEEANAPFSGGWLP